MQRPRFDAEVQKMRGPTVSVLSLPALFTPSCRDLVASHMGPSGTVAQHAELVAELQLVEGAAITSCC